MKFHSGLTANMALMLALWSVAITASPIMSVVDRLANHEAPGAPVVAAFMRELELERTNQQAWEAQYKKELNTYKTDGAYLEGTELATADKAVKDGLICIKHEDLTDYLTNTLGATWAKADAALTAKESLLAQIRNLLANADNEAMGLHCGDNKSEGAGKLCGILTQLEGEAAEERRLLEADQGVIEDHKSAVNDYMCDCTYSIWTTYPECDGDDVETVTTYTGCDVHDEDSCTLNENAKCGSGTTSITRTFKWGPKVGQDGDGKACDPTGEVDVDGDAGTLSEVNSDKEQTFTKDCMAGDYNGDCPVDCEWNDWEVELKDVVCKDDDELLVQCTDGDGNLAEGERFRTRTKKSTQAAGGKPCFYNEKLEEDGQKETEVCHYHDNADIDMKGEKAALAEKDETILALKTKMCEGDRGPCQNKGECEVTIKDNEVATWCNCPSTHTGTWCQDKCRTKAKMTSPSASSAWQNDNGSYDYESFGPQHALDENLRNYWQSSWLEKRPWMELGLDGMKKVAEVTLVLRPTDQAKSHLDYGFKNLEVFVKGEKQNVSCGIQSWTGREAQNKNFTYTFQCPEKANGNRIMITKDATGFELLTNDVILKINRVEVTVDNC